MGLLQRTVRGPGSINPAAHKKFRMIYINHIILCFGLEFSIERNYFLQWPSLHLMNLLICLGKLGIDDTEMPAGPL